MTAYCRSRTTSARRPESSFSSWSFVGIFLMVLVFLLPTSTDACDAPLRYESMMLKDSPKETYSPGDSVEYQCRPGYIRIIPPLPASAVCHPNNSWGLLQEACRRKPCPQPGDPVNGQVSGSFQFGSVAHYTCNEGYYLVGEATLYCELIGDNVGWNADPPHCEKILCQPPEQIENGVTSSHKEKYEYNEVVIYSCNPSSGPHKYSLIGESKLICSGHNVWSSDPPMCKVVKCESPIPKDGVLLSGHKTQFYYQDTVQLGCKEGFDLQGSKTVVCGANNNWEPQLPQCIKVPTPPSTTPPVATVSGTSPPASPSPPTGSLGGGVIAAIVFSVAAVLAVIGSYFLYRHKKKGKTEVNAEYRPCQDKSSTPAEHEVVSPKLA
ncbi:membrane cofactor protein-like isoform X2 [Artibeus jamaicensis]|uniref:membrane cofactor protein-like isoform X2 n=1 Tax=Artibeus jamaicensis TaxID=9417 RepID=UPI00235A910D|nr:membrane cofactor protein-like isoform X2 [Artibeus jamaicensis]